MVVPFLKHAFGNTVFLALFFFRHVPQDRFQYDPQLMFSDNSSAIVRSNLIKEISSPTAKAHKAGLGSQHVGPQRKGNGPVLQGPILFPVRPSAFGSDDQQAPEGGLSKSARDLPKLNRILAIKLLFSLSGNNSPNLRGESISGNQGLPDCLQASDCQFPPLRKLLRFLAGMHAFRFAR